MHQREFETHALLGGHYKYIALSKKQNINSFIIIPLIPLAWLHLVTVLVLCAPLVLLHGLG